MPLLVRWSRRNERRPAVVGDLAERVAGLEQRLHRVEHHVPAVRSGSPRLGSTEEIGVNAGETAHRSHRRDLPRHPRRRFGRGVVVEQRAKRQHEPLRRIGFDDLARDHGPASVDLVAVGRAHVPRRRDARVEEVARRQLGIDQRLPDAVLARLDVGLEDVSGLGHGSAPSRSRLRSTIAAAQGSANFEIHRSWISRIGTGFK